MKAYLAGGCFWCIAPLIKLVEGVNSVTAGYCGGDEDHPVYEVVKHQETGHRETICVDYVPSFISYPDLVKIFLQSVDPFDEGGQFIDRGFSYTLAIYCETPEQEAQAKEQIRALEDAEGRKSFVSVLPLKTFWPAEEYHQNYSEKNPEEFLEEWKASGREAYFGALPE